MNVVAHELAHQWWYGVVGNNQVKEPWLDEGLTTFSELLYMHDQVGGSAEFLVRAAKVSDEIHERRLPVTLYKYSDSIYGLMVYTRPAAMLWELMDEIGREGLEILRTYRPVQFQLLRRRFHPWPRGGRQGSDPLFQPVPFQGRYKKSGVA